MTQIAMISSFQDISIAWTEELSQLNRIQMKEPLLKLNLLRNYWKITS